MELKDTIELMTSDDYAERLKAEYVQLDIRVKKLICFLGKYKAGKLAFKPKCTYETLMTQLVYMCDYRRVLEQRAKIEGIDLPTQG